MTASTEVSGRVSRATLMRIIIAVVAVIAILTLPLWMESQYWLLVAADICVFAIFGMSYNILLGQIGLLSLGHALLFGFASYTVATAMTAGFGVIVSVLVAIGASALVGFLVGAATLHIRGIFFSIITLALGQAAFAAAATNLFGLTGGENGMRVPDIPEPLNVNFGSVNFYLLAAISMLVVLAVTAVLKRAPMGVLWRGIRDNHVRAESLGVNIPRQRLVGLTVSGAIAGFAGGLNALLLQISSPDQLSMAIQIQVLLIVIIGGPGSVLGPILGAIVVRLSGPLLDQLDRQDWLRQLPPQVERTVTSHDLILGILYILLVLFLPGGLISLAQRGRRGARRRPPPAADERSTGEPARIGISG